jgi:predicted amidohydrolase YtcJ
MRHEGSNAHQHRGPADLVLLNGNVVTVDDAHPEAEAVAIHGDTIIAVGRSEQIRALIGPKTQVLELDGKLVIPGFIEGHGHLVFLGQTLQRLNLRNARLREAVRDCRITDVGEKHLTVRAIKRLIDGALGARGAWLLEPYADYETSAGFSTLVHTYADYDGAAGDGSLEPADPLPCFYASVTCELPDGTVFWPDERMTREQALRAYTLNCAYAAHEETSRGSITPGKLADLVVLSQDITTVPPKEILSAKVLTTILGGEVVYQGQ